MNNNGVHALSIQNGYSNRRKGVRSLRCPMCGGALIYSEGTYDLACERNGIDSVKRGFTRALAAEMDPPQEPGACVFAISFTPSVNSAALWSIRMEHEKVDYTRLGVAIGEIQRRRFVELARNPIPAYVAAKEPEPPTYGEILARRYGLKPEDLFSIRCSTETIKSLARYYGIDEQAVRTIKHLAGKETATTTK